MKIIFSFIVVLSINMIHVYAQSKKDLKDAGVASRTETTVVTKKGTTVQYVESVEKYDENGNKLEVIEYSSNGDISQYVQYTYNDKGKVIKEVKLNPASKQPNSTIESIYSEDGKLITENYYDKTNQLKKTVDYAYDGNLKISKTTKNASGKIVETKTYTYEKKK